MNAIKPLILQVYRSRNGWRWRVACGRNGKILGQSSEAYDKLDAARRSLERVTGLTAPGVDVSAGERIGSRVVRAAGRAHELVNR